MIYSFFNQWQGAVEFARRASDPSLADWINQIIEGTESKVFEKHTIEQLLFAGYDDPLIDETKGLSDYPFDKFGWMYSRNGSSSDGRYTVATGLDSLFHIGQVIAWNNQSTLSGYTGECSHFGTASAGDLFPPERNSDAIQLFVGDTCRPISLNFASEQSNYPYLTFAGDETTYATNGTCYCTDSPCPPKGIANISSCVTGAPVYISFPHFLYGDSSLRHPFEGLQPNESKHAFSFQVDDKLGVPTQVNVAMQLNVALTVSDKFEFTKFQSQPVVYYPCIYFTSTAGLSRGMKMSLDFLHFALPVILIAVPSLLALLCLMVIALVSRKIYRLHHLRDELNDRLMSQED